MLKIKTKYFGQIEIDENKIITFVSGIVGFESLKKFILIDHPGNEQIKWLQSVEEPNFALPLVDPLLFFPDYSPTVSKEYISPLKIQSLADAVVLCVLTVPQDLKVTVNLKAPIILNPIESLADQIIAENPEYKTKHPIKLLSDANEGR
ncbi:flagellar assembly protein FliW [Thermosediminibacter oceani]|uniref:Flagellar assembly factor FliW n=1 Tax=Thermosediminibacter oceani (strain ATCC BAA-1034 / DSM 16646 / JW/IW-1228P) TaxID=555079 RepID=D9RYB0_THEOJ|nr:flagellar assembly protein FliW [Thermosediminibacter oceani]ADL08334.1 protein of unknown function DUF180 [Thermosediminibacter oceani DSM 16646]